VILTAHQRFLPVEWEFFLSTVASCTLRMDQREVLVQSVGFLSDETFLSMNWTNFAFNQFDYDCITMNWIVSLKGLEVTFVVIWCFINKTELNCVTTGGGGLCVTWWRDDPDTEVKE